MKRMLAWLLMLAVFVSACPSVFAAAESFAEGDYTYTVSGGKATITDASGGIRGEVTIPDTLGGYPVYCTDSEDLSTAFSDPSAYAPYEVIDLTEQYNYYDPSL